MSLSSHDDLRQRRREQRPEHSLTLRVLGAVRVLRARHIFQPSARRCSPNRTAHTPNPPKPPKPSKPATTLQHNGPPRTSTLPYIDKVFAIEPQMSRPRRPKLGRPLRGLAVDPCRVHPWRTKHSRCHAECLSLSTSNFKASHLLISRTTSSVGQRRPCTEEYRTQSPRRTISNQALTWTIPTSALQPHRLFKL